MFDRARARGFQISTHHHAEAILTHDMNEALADLEETLLDITLPASELVHGGGGVALVTQRIRTKLTNEFGWEKHNFEIRKIIDGRESESITHEIDHVKDFDSGKIALEIEWNTKDTSFDRDLQNFKTLHTEGAISVGVIITRGVSLQDSLPDIIETFAINNGINSIEAVRRYYHPTDRQIENINRQTERLGSFERGWVHAFISDKFGEATTHWRKLEDRVNRGVGNPCPLLLIGIPADVVVV